MKIAVARKILPNQFRSNDFSIAFDETAIGLIGEQAASEARHRERIGKSGQCGSLTALVYNLRRALNILGVEAMMAAVRG